MFSLLIIGLRAFLLLVAATVLGLSVTMTKQQFIGQVPAETSVGTFAGAVGFFGSTLGMAALWWDHVSGNVLVTLDGIASVLYLTSAVSLTIALKTVNSCTAMDPTSLNNRQTNKIISGGCIDSAQTLECPYATSSDGTDLTVGRCRMARIDYVFQYTGCVMGVFMIIMGYFFYRRGRGGTPPPTQY